MSSALLLSPSAAGTAIGIAIGAATVSVCGASVTTGAVGTGVGVVGAATVDVLEVEEVEGAYGNLNQQYNLLAFLECPDP